MEYLQMTLEEFKQEERAIQEDLCTGTKYFVRAGWRLHKIDRAQAYKLEGYKNIHEYARAVFRFRNDYASNLINVYKTFAVSEDVPELKTEYQGFEFSKLVDLMKISEEDREMFLPEAKRDSIREYQKFEKENENSPDRLMNWMKEPEDLIGKTVLEFFRNNKEILNTLFGSDAYRNGDMKEMVDIINPSGNRHYRHKTMFLMMYSLEKGLMVSEFGKQPEDMSWERFFSITQDIFGEAAAGDCTWEKYFGSNEDEQIPGQDNVMNHPELCPGNDKQDTPTMGTQNDTNKDSKQTESEVKAEIAPAQKSEETVPEEFEPQPENMISICYSCEHWSECNMKSNTVKECNEYVCKVEKTEEQRYSEEQNRIDKETEQKLQERADEEKMSVLPSDSGQQVHQIRLAKDYFDDVAAGVKSFELRKNDRGYKVGDTLELLEFSEGRNTGRLIRAEVTYILDDYTGIEDGYCIMAIKVVEVFE